jgi:2-hydroxychromene-2-carboxylate isomerase
MAETLEPVKLYYDYKSPFTYLAMEPAWKLEKTHRIRLRHLPHVFDFAPFGGGNLENRTELQWRKVRYLYMDARRFATERGLVIRGPQKLYDSRLALMGGTFADRHGKFQEFSIRVFERFFKRELDIEDGGALAAVMSEVGLDVTAFKKYAATDGPRDLKAAAEEGLADGVFGVPTFIVAGEMFWGNDRVDWVAKKLDAMGLRR